ncbi:MAG: gliding motility lipoprotein GldH [Bacteroidales bacterium]
MFRLPILASLFLLILVAFSCVKEGSYSEFRDIPAKGWNRYDTLFYTTKLANSKTYTIDIDTRNRANYPYQNLWLFVSCNQDSIEVFSDTIQIILADKMGHWYGSGWGSLYEFSTNYKKSFHFPKSNKPFIIKVVQGMRDYDLQGMESVGIRIESEK